MHEKVFYFLPHAFSSAPLLCHGCSGFRITPINITKTLQKLVVLIIKGKSVPVTCNEGP
jgi:hypothetical protein